jgi:ankyrin repeat protein
MPTLLRVIYIWAALTLVFFSLAKVILSFLAKRYLVIEEKPSPKVSISFVLQRIVAITVTLVVMVSSGIIGMRYFGKSLVSQSCLVCQVSKGNYGVSAWLIMIGADLDRPDEFGQTPLIHSVSRKQYWLTKLLIFSGANVEFKDKATITSPLGVAIYQGDIELIKFLLEHKADPNRIATGVLPLRIALKNKRIDIAKLLLEYGADPNKRDTVGMTPLLYESRWGNVNTVDFLISNKADVNVASNNNETPVYYAVANGKKDILISLLANGAKVGGNIPTEIKKTTNIETPLMAATRLNNEEIKQILIDNGAK